MYSTLDIDHPFETPSKGNKKKERKMISGVGIQTHVERFKKDEGNMRT